ncbi:MAG: Dabb family protein [Pseudomonadota bacterium]
MIEPVRRSRALARLCALLLVCLAVWARADGGIEHVVIIWLNDTGNTAHRARVLEASRVLAGIPGVTAVRGGTVAASARPSVDDSFDVGLVISLTDRAALDAYLVHPQHLQLVNETLRPLVRRILVYDLHR